MLNKKISVIGSGFSSLSAACYLAQAGFEVNVYEKNAQLGGRARQYSKDGFLFDMGPTWYWMPDVFDNFFADFGKKTSDYYALEKLDPGYRVYFGENDFIDIDAVLEKIFTSFEAIEKGSAKKLEKFIKKAESNYNIAVRKLVYKPGLSPLELVTKDTILELKQFVLTIRDIVFKEFKNPKLRQLLEFPVLFLGAKPSDTPAFYSFMNFADFGLGTWHPKGGMYEVIKAMHSLATELGVVVHTESPVEKIRVEKGKTIGIVTNGQSIDSDYVLSGADYHHSETLLEPQYRQYSENFWARKTFAPSSLLFYIGFDTKLKNVEHHNLFFDTDFELHSQEIYDDPMWPSDPLFYANFPSITDSSMAPDGCETGFFLVPIAPGLEDTPELREQYFDLIMARFQERTEQRVENNIIFKESFCVNDFIKDYNSYKGNAYGLANTLFQTAFLRPKIKSKKVKDLFFTGQLTVPGPGVPPAIISGKIVSDMVIKNSNNH